MSKNKVQFQKGMSLSGLINSLQKCKALRNRVESLGNQFYTPCRV
jgi:hypothetical protein